MFKYRSILRLGWLDALEYRTEFLVSIIGWGIRLFIAVFLWLAVANPQGGQIGPYSFQTILSYFFLVQIISSLIFSRVGFDIAADIYRGDFSNFLLKPLNYLFFRLVHEVSKNIFRLVLSLLLFGIPLFFISGDFTLSFKKIPFILFAMAGAYGINFCLVTIIALSAFWVANATRFTFIYFSILTIFSGMIVPLDLFPQKFYEFIQILPFPFIFFFPVKVIQSKTFDWLLLKGFVFQTLYVFILIMLTWGMYRRGVKKFEGLGR